MIVINIPVFVDQTGEHCHTKLKNRISFLKGNFIEMTLSIIIYLILFFVV